jgi:hypothetical protein
MSGGRRRLPGSQPTASGGSVKAVVSWEDTEGTVHRFEIAYDPDDAEARLFLEGIELHVRFRLETFDAGSNAG